MTQSRQDTVEARRDVRCIKRERAKLKREAIALVEKHLQTRRCYWTWPFGHSFPGHWVTTSPAYKVTRCEHCGRPYTWDSFDVYDVLHLGEKAGMSDEELEPLFDRWRELP